MSCQVRDIKMSITLRQEIERYILKQVEHRYLIEKGVHVLDPITEYKASLERLKKDKVKRHLTVKIDKDIKDYESSRSYTPSKGEI